MIPKASTDLFGYKHWRNNLVPYPVGTMFRFLKDYTPPGQSFRVGQLVKVMAVRDAMLYKHEKVAGDMIYELVICSVRGKPFTKSLFLSVEGVEHWMEDGQLEKVA